MVDLERTPPGRSKAGDLVSERGGPTGDAVPLSAEARTPSAEMARDRDCPRSARQGNRFVSIAMRSGISRDNLSDTGSARCGGRLVAESERLSDTHVSDGLSDVGRPSGRAQQVTSGDAANPQRPGATCNTRLVNGKHIELFLVDGTPGGLTTAEILNWTGQVLRAPRSEMSALIRRPEVGGTCLYLLLGPDEQGGTRCYIGETDDFRARLRQHDANKEFWRQVVVVTSKDANLTKAHGRYLESRLISLALQAGRVILDNGTTPPPQALPEAHAADMDYFVEQMQIVLPVLGVDAIRGREVTMPNAGRRQLVSPVFHLVNKKLGVDARAQQIDGEFTVLAGSSMVADWHGVGRAASTIKAYNAYRAQHGELIAHGSIVVENGTGRVAKDIVFGSPSTAGAIAQGRSCNGRTSWVAEDGTSFGSWESRGIGATEGL